MNEPIEQTVNDYDRLRGGLQGVGFWVKKPSTVQSVQQLTGFAKTFIIETTRQEDGDYIFVQCSDRNGHIRIALPPKVANAIASQRESLTKRRRSAVSKAAAQARMDAGIQPGFLNPDILAKAQKARKAKAKAKKQSA